MTENQCIIDLDTKKNRGDTLLAEWVFKVSDEVNDLRNNSSLKWGRWRNQSIYKVPSSVKNLCSSSNAYEPQTVSIGPYHHGEEHLKAMEEHKHRAFLHFIVRSGTPLELYVEALAPVVADLKDAYDQLADKWQQDTDSFLKMMIVDGCFILELLRTKFLNQMDYEDDDPVFRNDSKLFIVPSYLKRDMLILENQLPMLVLSRLLLVSGDKVLKIGTHSSIHQEHDVVTRLVLKFFSQPYDSHRIEQLGKCLHILDVYRKSLLLIPGFRKDKKEESRGRGHNQHKREYDIIRSATELNEAGVRIKKSETGSLKDISFGGGVLELPLIVVDETLESQYLNLLAFERFHVEACYEVTSFVFFMDNLIDSARDVSLLHSRGIIRNELGSHRAIANLFNSPWTISKGISLDPDTSLDDVYMKISEYCQKPWPRWQASLRHKYFTNPWTLISVIAAVFIFALTSIQTVYTVLSYDPRS